METGATKGGHDMKAFSILEPGAQRNSFTATDLTFELAEAGKAHEVLAGRNFFGGLVLRVP